MQAQELRHRTTGRLLALACGILIALASALPVSARTDLINTTPGANASLANGPSDIRLSFNGPVDPSRSTITVYTSDQQKVAIGDVHTVANDLTALTAPVRGIAKGVYTVVWTVTAVGDTTATNGTFAFATDPSQNSPAVVQQPNPVMMLQPLTRVIPKWLAFVTLMTFIGTLALRFLVWSPVSRCAAKESGNDSIVRAADRRLLILAGSAIVCFVPALVTQLAWEAANAAKRPFSASFDVGFLRTFLGTHGAGNLWAIRLLLTVLAVAVIVPAAVSALRPSWQRNARRADLVVLLGLIFGLSEFLVQTLPTRVAPGMMFRAIVTSLLDWTHLSGASLWIGGVIGLVATASLLRVPRGAPATLLVGVIRRFSLVALLCVGAMIVSGLWTAWIHVGGLSPLFTTLYGRTLLIKLVLVCVLIALGADNLLWILPRVESIRESEGGEHSLLAIALHHFRRVIAMEMVVGVTILLIVPFLASSARNQAAQNRASDLRQTIVADGLPITLHPSALQPGIVNYDITVPIQDAARVIVAFASRDLNIPETNVIATAQGNDAYRVSGMYTPIVGRWQARVTVHQNGQEDRSAQFDLPISAKPVTAPALPTPPVRTSTWAWGITEVALVVLVLGGAALASRRLAQTLAQQAMSGDEARRTHLRTIGLFAVALVGVAVLAVLVWQAIAEHGALPDPTDPEAGLSTGMVIINSGILVFREGLETILVLAAVTASFLGANAGYRRPVAAGAGAAIGATIITWFVVVTIIDSVNAPALHVQAATGLLAIIVLLIVMNWFFHRVYWTGWIGHHQRRRKELLESVGSRTRERILLGVALLGFTSVYREGFEVVLFLQSLRLQAGTGAVLAGVAIGLALTAGVGVLTFIAHHQLPYKKMLVLTGIMLAAVLVLMIGENVQEMQLANWLPTTAIGLPIPDWMGTWFAIFPNVEGLVAQVLAAVLVIGSYFGAEYARVWLPQRRGETPAHRPERPPMSATNGDRQTVPSM